MATPLLTIHELRQRWQPHKERLSAKRDDHPTPIRFHRACSWLQRVEQMDEKDSDLALVSQWIAFNALYGQWDASLGHSVADRESWRVFLDRILDLDKAGHVAGVLREHKALVLSLLEDEHLSSLFWQDPCPKRAAQARRAKIDAQAWYVETNWKLLLDHVVDRVYLLRCQLMHGAATFGGRLNRRALRRCTQMMGHLLPAILLVWIEFGADEDWGIMCYPPMRGGVVRASGAPTRSEQGPRS